MTRAGSLCGGSSRTPRGRRSGAGPASAVLGQAPAIHAAAPRRTERAAAWLPRRQDRSRRRRRVDPPGHELKGAIGVDDKRVDLACTLDGLQVLVERIGGKGRTDNERAGGGLALDRDAEVRLAAQAEIDVRDDGHVGPGRDALEPRLRCVADRAGEPDGAFVGDEVALAVDDAEVDERFAGPTQVGEGGREMLGDVALRANWGPLARLPRLTSRSRRNRSSVLACCSASTIRCARWLSPMRRFY